MSQSAKKGDLTTTAKPSGDVASVKQALDAINPKLYQLYLSGVDLAATERHATIQSRYSLGRLLIDAAKIGEIAFTALAAQLNLEKGQAADSVMVAKRVNQSELNAFLKLRTEKGIGLTWSHLVYLSEIEDNSERRQLAEQTAKENMTTNELHNHIRGLREGRVLSGQRSGAGRPFARPKTFDQLIMRTERETRSYVRWLEEGVRNCFDDLMIETAPDKFDAAALEEMREVALELAKAAAEAEAAKSRIEAKVAELAASQEITLSPPAVAGKLAAPAAAEVPASKAPAVRARPVQKVVAAGRRRSGSDAKTPPIVMTRPAPKRRGAKAK